MKRQKTATVVTINGQRAILLGPPVKILKVVKEPEDKITPAVNEAETRTSQVVPESPQHYGDCEYLYTDEEHVDIQPETSTSTSNKTEVQITNPSDFQCHRCAKHFKTLPNLRRHEAACSDKKPSLQCKHCDYQTTRRDTLSKHIARKHKDESPLERVRNSYRDTTTAVKIINWSEFV